MLTQSVQRQIVASLRAGNYLVTACTAAGITVQTFDYWRKLCESGVEHAQIYADFFGAVKAAGAVAESESLEKIRAGVAGWQGNAWFLERRFPQKWAAAKDRPAKANTASRREVVSKAKQRAEEHKRNRGDD